MPTASASVNGKHNLDYDKIEDDLTTELTAGYRPRSAADGLYGSDGLPLYFPRTDLAYMEQHPIVLNVLEYFKSGIAGVEFEVKCQHGEIGQFLLEQCERYWDRGVPKLQEGYAWGWSGAEAIYSCAEGGPLKWDNLVNFAPLDTFILTQKHVPVGVRVKNILDEGDIDLPMASECIPAKGLWYAHEPRYNQLYGRSALRGAWRPWRRLAWKDGAESVTDGAVYRFGYSGPVVGYPQEDIQGSGPPGAPNTSLDSQGNPRRFARDIARQIAEQAKAGAGIGLPSTVYPNTSIPKWSLLWPDHVINVDPLINYIKYLHDSISYGIGVPPELMEAAESGSGYSGRKIPKEAFLSRQQRIADAFLNLFVEQVLGPLVRWNWGEVSFECKVKNLLKSERKAGQQQEEENQADKMGQQQGQPGAPQPPAGGAGGQKFPPQGAGFSLSHPQLITERMKLAVRKILSLRAA